MIVPDVNVLVHAYNAHSSRHELARDWWEAVLSGDELVGLSWVTVLGFIRLTTNRVVFKDPWGVDEALQRVEEWLGQPNVRILQPTGRHFEWLSTFLTALRTGANLTSDAHLAALATEHGGTVYTTDADFARFPGLSWKNPLVA